jgi:hypothetical protein
VYLGERHLHANGQVPAYEWNFSDVNLPVHPWATLALCRAEEAARGKGDVAYLKRSFGKFLANFTWWLNHRDRHGENVFEGGFLALDNTGVFEWTARPGWRFSVRTCSDWGPVTRRAGPGWWLCLPRLEEASMRHNF